MAQVSWTEPALSDLEAIADYIALDKPDAAIRYVQTVFSKTDRLARYPKSGSVPPEIPHLPYRQIIVPPCRIFYRTEGNNVFIVHVMRSEQQLDEDLIIHR
jgi:toxin ParE1/3/4